MTWIKAEIDDETDEYINDIQERLELNKADAVAFILETSAQANQEYKELINE